MKIKYLTLIASIALIIAAVSVSGVIGFACGEPNSKSIKVVKDINDAIGSNDTIDDNDETEELIVGEGLLIGAIVGISFVLVMIILRRKKDE